ncbi:MAG: 50S ribosomal protein L19e, partial [Nitrososphaerota archaeon]
MAAEILKVGVSRVRMDPESSDRIQDAITKDAIRTLIKEGVIWAVPAKGVSRGRWRQKRGKRRGRGSIKGAAGAR